MCVLLMRDVTHIVEISLWIRLMGVLINIILNFCTYEFKF